MPIAPLYNWKIAGEAGYGIMNTGGPIFAKTVLRAGFFVMIYSEYPSLIRGGHNTMQVAVNIASVLGPYWEVDQLIALNTNAIAWHNDEVKKGGVVIYDEKAVKCIEDKGKGKEVDNSRIPPLTGVHSVERARRKTRFRKDVHYLSLPFESIAEEVGGNKIMKNVASIGAALAVFSQKVAHKADILKIGKGVIEDVFREKGDRVIKPNQDVLEAGFKAI